MDDAQRRTSLCRHFPTLLARWRGSDARLWELHPSHCCLLIRLERQGEPGHLVVYCGGPISISGPVRWSSAAIQIEPSPDGRWHISDPKAGLLVVAEGVE